MYPARPTTPKVSGYTRWCNPKCGVQRRLPTSRILCSAFVLKLLCKILTVSACVTNVGRVCDCSFAEFAPRSSICIVRRHIRLFARLLRQVWRGTLELLINLLFLIVDGTIDLSAKYIHRHYDSCISLSCAFTETNNRIYFYFYPLHPNSLVISSESILGDGSPAALHF